jgi:hypothetical protein
MYKAILAMTNLFLIYAIGTTESAATDRNSYNLLHLSLSDPLAMLPVFDRAAAKSTTSYFNATMDFTTVDLTTTDVANINNILKTMPGILEPNYEYQLQALTDPDEISAGDEPTHPRIIENVVPCDAVIRGHDIVILDSLIYPQSASLKGIPVITLANLTNNGPCLAHATYIAEIMSNMINANASDLRFINVAVFNCGGTANVYTLLRAIDIIIKYHKNKNNKRGLTVNFSGVGAYSELINAGFKELVSNNIRTVYAAGNNNQLCSLHSPASELSGESIGATSGQTRRSTSNYGSPTADCVDVYLPGCASVTNPLRLTKITQCGTSFSCPQEVVRGMIVKQQKPKATPAQIKKILKDNTFLIPMHPDTPDDGYTMRVVDNENACLPDKRIIKRPIVIGKKNSGYFSNWYPIPNPNLKFCVSIVAKGAGDNSLLMGLRSNSTLYTITVDVKASNNRHTSSIKDTSGVLDRLVYANRFISKKPRKIIIETNTSLPVVQMKVYAVDKDKPRIPILNAFLKNKDPITEVSLGANKGGVTYNNALLC